MPTFEEAEEAVFVSLYPGRAESDVPKPPGTLAKQLSRSAHTAAGSLRPAAADAATRPAVAAWVRALGMQPREVGHAVVQLALTAVAQQRRDAAPGDAALAAEAAIAALGPPPLMADAAANLSQLWDAVAAAAAGNPSPPTPPTMAEAQQRAHTVLIANAHALLAEWLEAQRVRCRPDSFSDDVPIVMLQPLYQAQRLASSCATGDNADSTPTDTWRMRLGLPRDLTPAAQKC